MKRASFFVLALALGLSAPMLAEDKPAAKKSAAEMEKDKALQNPYPNDLGVQEIDAAVKGYPAPFQEGYKILKARCAQCHEPARPLNSRFVEPYVGDEKADPKKLNAMKEAKIAEWKKSNPELFQNPAVWQIEPGMWKRYVKRMQAKPGCKMSGDEAKKVWMFLVYDSSQRKLGPNAGAWKAHREKLLEEFKAKYPERYKRLSEEKDL